MSRQPITSDAAAAAGTALDHSQLKDAARADHQEHSVSLKQAFLTHKKAIFWSMAMSAALVMEGYDVSLLGSFYGHPAFLRRFGVEAPGTTNGYIIPAPWQSGLSNGASAGGIIGLFINGWAADKFGSRYVMMASLVAMTAIIFMMVFANSLGMLVAAQVLVGLPWGVFQTLTTAYASEVCPIQLRGYLTAYVNMCWGIGILISSGVVKASLKMETDWAWRLPFTLQWIWIPPLFAIVWLCPESPWWLVRKGRNEDALRALQRLADPVRYTEDDAAATVSMMVHTTEMERQTTAGARYIDCFRGVDRRRTEISMMAFGMQITSGQGLVGQGVQFLQTAGISTDLAYSLNIIMNAMFVIGTMCSWVLLSLAGRRTLYSGGMFCMAVTLVIIGGLSFNRDNPKTMAIGSLLIFLNFLYNSTLGPITYTIIGEMSSTRLRGKSIVLARITYKAVNIVNGIILPRMLSPKAWNLGPKCGLVYAGTATLSFLYCLLRLPETRGRSYGELNILFEKKIPAWRFKTTEVEQFVSDDLEEDVRGDDKKGEIAHIP